MASWPRGGRALLVEEGVGNADLVDVDAADDADRGRDERHDDERAEELGGET